MNAVQTPAAAAARGPAAGADCAMQFTGVLVHAEVAMRPLGDGTFVPAIKLELDDVGAGHHRLVAHVLYQPAEHEHAEAKVRTLRRGAQISVSSQLTDVRLLLPAASFPNDKP